MHGGGRVRCVVVVGRNALVWVNASWLDDATCNCSHAPQCRSQHTVTAHGHSTRPQHAPAGLHADGRGAKLCVGIDVRELVLEVIPDDVVCTVPQHPPHRPLSDSPACIPTVSQTRPGNVLFCRDTYEHTHTHTTQKKKTQRKKRRKKKEGQPPPGMGLRRKGGRERG